MNIKKKNNRKLKEKNRENSKISLRRKTLAKLGKRSA